MMSSRRSGPARAAVVASVATIALALLVAASAQAAWTPSRGVGVLTADELLPQSAAEIDAMRRAKRALPAGSALAKIESAVQDRAALVLAASDPRRGMLLAELATTFATPLVPVDESGRLLVRIAGTNADARVAELVALGVEPVAVATGYGFLEAWIAPDRVNAVAELPWIRLIAAPGLPVAETGLQLSEGDAIHRADQARTTYAVTGAGATVGVISDGVSNLAAAQATLDLPAGVNVGFAGNGDEGTAMLEIVHDLAPGAGLAFYGAGSGSAGMIAAQNWLVGTAGARIVSDDIWLTREPYFEDGPVALNAAALVTGNDVVYFTSAGNRAQRHIPQAFRDGGARALGILGASRPHDFGGGDVTADVRLRNPSGTGVRHTIVLQWSEQFGRAARDFDLYLVDPTFSNILALSTNAQSGAGDPLELIDFTYNGPDNVPARIVVDYAGALPAPAGITLKIAANGPTFLEYVDPAGSINPHARHPLVYALGAIDQADSGNDTMEGFSSRGPAQMFFPAAVSRDKPDASAVDGVTVTGAGGFGSPFFGTSAASPHGAGIAALLRGVLPALTAADVRTILSATAVDIGAAGFDAASGAGRLDALAALSSQLNQPPVADAGPDTTVECAGGAGTSVQLNGLRSSDPDGDALTYAWSAPGITFDDPSSATPTAAFPLGATTVTLTVADGSLSDDDEVIVTIEDTTPPVVTVTVDPDALWPPNHKLAPVHATVLVTDACDAAPEVRLVAVTSDEPDDGLGDGDRPDDIQVVGPAALPVDFLLRSERQGPGDGRVYTLCYEAEDESGNVGSACATVIVTHDRPAAAAFIAPSAGADVTLEGGWIEFAGDDEALLSVLTGDVPDIGGDAFARVVAAETSTVGGEDGGAQAAELAAVTVGGSTMRWYVPGDVLRQALAGAETPTLYARFERDGQGVLATVPLPITPLALARVASLGGARGASVEPVDGADPAAPAGAIAAPAAPDVSALPARLLLAAANPLPRGGALRFGVPREGRVRVSLVAANGRRVALLADGETAPGWHRVSMPATLDPGTYFAVAEQAGERVVAKVIVLR